MLFPRRPSTGGVLSVTVIGLSSQFQIMPLRTHIKSKLSDGLALILDNQELGYAACVILMHLYCQMCISRR